MDFLGALNAGSSLLGAAGGLFGGGEGSAKRFRNRQQDFLEESFLKQNQIRVNDLRSAGLNPMLAVGASANAPSVAPNSDSPSAAKQANISRAAAASQAMLNAVSAKNIQAQTKAANAQEENLKADTSLKAAQERNAEADNTFKQIQNSIEMNTAQERINTARYLEQVNKTSAKSAQIDNEILESDFGKIMKALGFTGSNAKDVSNIMKSFVGKKTNVIHSRQ